MGGQTRYTEHMRHMPGPARKFTLAEHTKLKQSIVPGHNIDLAAYPYYIKYRDKWIT
jgi:hypothetical protein